MPTPLAQTRVFAGLNETALQFLSERAHYVTRAALQVIVHEGDPGDRLFAIQSGEVRACRNFAKVGELELARLRAGECFGEMCVVDTLPRSATIQATQDTALYSVDTPTLYELHRLYPAQFSVMLLNLARELSRRLRRLDQAFAAWH